jgi:hypothetical protein
MRNRHCWLAGVVVLGFFVTAGAGILATDRVLSWLYGGPGIFGQARPRMVDVLEGRVFGDERQAAIMLVQLRGAAVPHDPNSTVVAQQIATSCDEGQNNWKVHDGYRIKCTADSVRYVAWRGDFALGAERATNSLSSLCVNVSKPGEYGTVTPEFSGFGGVWTCADGTELWSYWYTTTDLDSSGSRFEHSFSDSTWTGGGRRAVSGRDVGDVRADLRGYDWFAMERLEKVYYQDAP